MPWFKIFTQRAHIKGIHEEFEGLIPAKNAIHARDKANNMWHRKVLRVEEVDVLIRETKR